MPSLELPDEPTPEILDAIKRAMFAPLNGATREQVIYRAVVRAAGKPAVRKVWRIEGSGREVEPTSHTLEAQTEAEIGKAVTELHADGFPTITVTDEVV